MKKSARELRWSAAAALCSLLMSVGVQAQKPEDAPTNSSLFQSEAPTIRTVGDFRDFMDEARVGQEPVYEEAARAVAEAGVERIADIRYAKLPGVDPARLSLDIYLRQGLKKAPMVLFVHGGGWMAGDKEAVLWKPAALVPAGYLVASSNYRFRPEASLTEMATDVAQAAAWLVAHASEYGGDPGRLFLMGHSAGAHMVALVGTNERFLEEAGLGLPKVRGVIPLDTALYNVPLEMSRESEGTPIFKLAFSGNEEQIEAASPWHHVAAGKSIPPFLVFYSDGREAAPRQPIPFVERLVDAGVEAKVFEAEGKDHSGLNRDLGRPGDPSTRLVLDFLDHYSKTEK